MPPKRKTVAQSSSLSAALGRGEQPAVITFDRDARRDYLTGFHKRKLQRIKQAKAVAADIEKQAKLDARKQVLPFLSSRHPLRTVVPWCCGVDTWVDAR